MEVNRPIKRQTHMLRFNKLILIVLLLSLTVNSIKLESLDSNDLDEDQVSEYAMVLAEQDDEV